MLQASDERPPGPLERFKRPAVVLFVALATVGAARWLGSPGTGQPVALPTIAAGARPAREVKVHVTGAVVQPGLYTFADGLRVADAIEQAGGPVDGADVGRLNLALRLQDGQQLVVPRVGEPVGRPPATARPAAGSGPSPAAPTTGPTPPRAGAPGPARAGQEAAPPERRLNRNRASAAELEALPAIGRVVAERIVRYREEHGPLGSPDDLRRAGLVSRAALERIRDLVEAP